MSLRISAPSKDGGRRGPGGEQLEPDFYMARVIKLIPAEAVAVFPLVLHRADRVVEDVVNTDSATKLAQSKLDFATSQTEPGTALSAKLATEIQTLTQKLDTVTTAAEASVSWLPIAMAWAILLLVILVRWQATRGPDGRAQWGAVAIAAISFFLWVPVSQGSFGVFEVLSAISNVPIPETIKTFIPEMLLIFWTILIPVFYKPTG